MDLTTVPGHGWTSGGPLVGRNLCITSISISGTKPSPLLQLHKSRQLPTGQFFWRLLPTPFSDQPAAKARGLADYKARVGCVRPLQLPAMCACLRTVGFWPSLKRQGGCSSLCWSPYLNKQWSDVGLAWCGKRRYLPHGTRTWMIVEHSAVGGTPHGLVTRPCPASWV